MTEGYSRNYPQPMTSQPSFVARLRNALVGFVNCRIQPRYRSRIDSLIRIELARSEFESRAVAEMCL